MKDGVVELTFAVPVFFACLQYAVDPRAVVYSAAPPATTNRFESYVGM